MKDYKFSVKLTLVLVYLAMVAFLGITIAFPFIVEWYVEVRKKDPTLATTIMLVYYPCMPFIAAFLISLRGILKNIKNGLVWGDANIRFLKITAISCLCAAVIMIIGGFKYMPFWVSGASALAGAVLCAVMERVFSCALYNQREKELNDMRELYEEDDNIGNRK